MENGRIYFQSMSTTCVNESIAQLSIEKKRKYSKIETIGPTCQGNDANRDKIEK